jgi:hypothetical protein
MATQQNQPQTGRDQKAKPGGKRDELPERERPPGTSNEPGSGTTAGREAGTRENFGKA